jgi:hypothetical protein
MSYTYDADACDEAFRSYLTEHLVFTPAEEDYIKTKLNLMRKSFNASMQTIIALIYYFMMLYEGFGQISDEETIMVLDDEETRMVLDDAINSTMMHENNNKPWFEVCKYLLGPSKFSTDTSVISNIPEQQMLIGHFMESLVLKPEIPLTEESIRKKLSAEILHDKSKTLTQIFQHLTKQGLLTAQ